MEKAERTFFANDLLEGFVITAAAYCIKANKSRLPYWHKDRIKTERSFDMLMHKFGLNGYRKKTYVELSELFCLSYNRCLQICHAAIRMLSEVASMNNIEFEDFILDVHDEQSYAEKLPLIAPSLEYADHELLKGKL